MNTYAVADHAPSLLPEGKKWKLVWNDEFDGKTLDKTKWDFRREIMGIRNHSWCGEEAIELDGKSNCHIRLIEKDGYVQTAQLQTGYNFMDAVRDEAGTRYSSGLNWPIAPLKKNLFLHSFGYYECRCRLQRRNGWWSAFWLQSPIIGASLDPAQTGMEIDIMESFVPGECIKHHTFWGGYGADMKNANTGAGEKNLDPEAYHYFGVEWAEDGYTFYIDGKQDGHIPEPVSHCPGFILVGAEVRGYRDKDHLPTDEARASAAAGDEFIVDHVRVFDAV